MGETSLERTFSRLNQHIPRAGAAPFERKDEGLLPFDVPLTEFSRGSKDKPFDLLVVGCGPSGLGVADEAAKRGLSVGIIDPRPLQRWPNNYGVWVDEFEALGHDDCFARIWNSATVIVDEGKGNGVTLDRPYAQVDRDKLKTKLLKRSLDNGAEFCTGAVSEVKHLDDVSIVSVGEKEFHAVQVLDATGHARRLVEFERDFTPGYQAAYGATIEVDTHPYDLNKMMFMDWRGNHLDPELRKRNDELPTFLYVMPYTRNKIFVEETSLVARPYIPFDELKLRLEQRLASMGITVRAVEDEEYCLIPMGGVLPKMPQRTLGIGGTAGMVHPATGYMVSKSLFQAPILVDAIQNGIKMQQNSDKSLNASQISEAVWNNIWPEEDRRQRTFMCFGMEILMRLNKETTQRFFKTFFTLSKRMWGGFLSWRISALGLLGVGLSIFRIASNQLRYDFVKNALPYLPSFVKTFTQASNDFDSTAWAGLYEGLAVLYNVSMIQPTRPFDSTRDNPTKQPIRSSSINFADRVIKPRDGEDQDSGINSGPLSLENLDKVSDSAGKLTDDRDWIDFQQRKTFSDQATLASSLPRLNPNDHVDVLVAGVGPAGLALAGELAERGVDVGLVGPETSFTNNYGVWEDEFKDLGLEHTLEKVYDETLVVIDEKKGYEAINRKYARVGRKELRDHLVSKCKNSGRVRYLSGIVEGVSRDTSEPTKIVELQNGDKLSAKFVTMSTGHNREVLEYEEGPPPTWQTAYGIEIAMKNHPWASDKAVFMDLSQSDDENPGVSRVPSFLYILPDEDKVFLEETCLVSQVQVPFDELKRRLYKRLQNMGVTVDPESIIEEEASWIPLGGPLPKVPQSVLGFGAAAGLVHPASGYSIVNSLKMASSVADSIVEGLGTGDFDSASMKAWQTIWSDENRQKMAFYQFGSDLIAKMSLSEIKEFMRTFYSLPSPLWKGFLSHDLNPAGLMVLAISMFAIGGAELRMSLISELASPAGVKMAKAAAYPYLNNPETSPQDNLSEVLTKRNRKESLRGVFRREQLAQNSVPVGHSESSSVIES
eukprot:CAMPEP_0167762396 /NCGR_PEP_ID=MMETSP0110_2-20121227/12744_1 /TAXON_ID=629695 /ORGANISM="Gymnochlora sp., Strain CCMP2014" /LENGTH=1052 /DNA_ID=CAMNT_0007649265 /DNA_START=179 /DNA_END=3337 /DNA_ORIENTATION=+